MLPGTTLLKQRDIQIIECLCIPHSYQAMASSSGISPAHLLAAIQSCACPLQTAWAFANLSSTSRQTSMAHDCFGPWPDVQLNHLASPILYGQTRFFPILSHSVDLHGEVLLQYKGMCIYLHSLSALTPFFSVSVVQVMNSSVALFKCLLADSFFNEMTPECYQLASRCVSLFRILQATVHPG